MRNEDYLLMICSFVDGINIRRVKVDVVRVTIRVHGLCRIFVNFITGICGSKNSAASSAPGLQLVNELVEELQHLSHDTEP